MALVNLRKVQAARPAPTVGAVGHAADDLGQDHAAVAASAGQGTAAECVGDRVEVALVLRQRLGRRQRSPHRGQHVGAGVPVGDGKHVERIDLLDVALEVTRGGGDGADERRTVDVEARHRSGCAASDPRVVRT